MRRFVEIVWSSLKMALQEFRSNKLRTFLSLLGVTFGIFCIISVLSTIDSLERAVQADIKSLGTNTIYIDKWEFSGENDYPWWKYVKRPEPTQEEMEALKAKVPAAANIAFLIETNNSVEVEDNVVSNVVYYGVTEDFFSIQKVEIILGRTLQSSDFDNAIIAALSVQYWNAGI